MLVLTGGELQGHGIGRPLHEFYESRILPLGALRGLRYSQFGVPFRELIGWLLHALYHLEGVNLSQLIHDQIRRYEQRIMSGDYGFDYFFLLNPIMRPIDPSLYMEHPLAQLWVAEQNVRLWALNACRNWTKERFPPDKLLIALGEARRMAEQYQRGGQFIPAPAASAKWWRGDALVWREWGLVGALPILIGIWLRCFSIFGCGKCLTPPEGPRR